MSGLSLSTVMQELFSAPLNAVTKAERDYRLIWANWLHQKLELIKAANGGNLPGNLNIEELLKTAPVVSLDGVINSSLTMRIAGIKESTTGLQGGLQIGPIYGGGTYSSTSRSTEESVFNASTSFTLSNHQAKLVDFLASAQIPIPQAGDVDSLVEILKKDDLPDPPVVADE